MNARYQAEADMKRGHASRFSLRSMILIALALMIVLPSPVGGAPKFSEWGTPQNLGCVVNSPFDDAGAALSKNGLSLYFGSNRPDGSAGGFDIWVSRRASVDAPWGPPENLGTIVNTAANEAVPSFSRDGHWMFFNSNRDGSSDIWASWRDDVHNDFAWQPPVKLGEGVNSAQFEAGPGYFENESGRPLLFLGKGASALTSDIYVSELQPDGSFGQAVVVPELSSAQADQRPSVRFDGLEIFFGRLFPPGGNFELMVSTRDSVSDPWGIPTNLGPTVNSPVEDAQPHIAADRVTLLFSSTRSGGCGTQVNADLYMTTRTKEHGHSHDQDADD
jgi:hypothetical protein